MGIVKGRCALNGTFVDILWCFGRSEAEQHAYRYLRQ